MESKFGFTTPSFPVLYFCIHKNKSKYQIMNAKHIEIRNNLTRKILRLNWPPFLSIEATKLGIFLTLQLFIYKIFMSFFVLTRKIPQMWSIQS